MVDENDDTTKEDLEAHRRGELHSALLFLVEQCDEIPSIQKERALAKLPKGDPKRWGHSLDDLDDAAERFLGGLLAIIRVRGADGLRKAVREIDNGGLGVGARMALSFAELVDAHGIQDVAWMLLVIKADREELAGLRTPR